MINNPNYAVAINLTNVCILVVLVTMAFYHGLKHRNSHIDQFSDPDYYFLTIALFFIIANGMAFYRSIFVYLLGDYKCIIPEPLNLASFLDRTAMLFGYLCLMFLGRNYRKLRF